MEGRWRGSGRRGRHGWSGTRARKVSSSSDPHSGCAMLGTPNFLLNPPYRTPAPALRIRQDSRPAFTPVTTAQQLTPTALAAPTGALSFTSPCGTSHGLERLGCSRRSPVVHHSLRHIPRTRSIPSSAPSASIAKGPRCFRTAITCNDSASRWPARASIDSLPHFPILPRAPQQKLPPIPRCTALQSEASCTSAAMGDAVPRPETLVQTADTS